MNKSLMYGFFTIFVCTAAISYASDKNEDRKEQIPIPLESMSSVQISEPQEVLIARGMVCKKFFDLLCDERLEADFYRNYVNINTFIPIDPEKGVFTTRVFDNNIAIRRNGSDLVIRTNEFWAKNDPELNILVQKAIKITPKPKEYSWKETCVCGFRGKYSVRCYSDEKSNPSLVHYSYPQLGQSITELALTLSVSQFVQSMHECKALLTQAISQQKQQLKQACLSALAHMDNASDCAHSLGNALQDTRYIADYQKRLEYFPQRMSLINDALNIASDVE